MTAKPVILRKRARQDMEQAIDWYRGEAGEDVAVGFVDAAGHIWSAIAANPGIGSPRYDHELNLPGLRSRMLKRYPYLAFYIEQDDYIDVWRVLHAQRDIRASLQEREE